MAAQSEIDMERNANQQEQADKARYTSLQKNMTQEDHSISMTNNVMPISAVAMSADKSDRQIGHLGNEPQSDLKTLKIKEEKQSKDGDVDNDNQDILVSEGENVSAVTRNTVNQNHQRGLHIRNSSVAKKRDKSKIVQNGPGMDIM